ncbi:hypothetical protein psal_cds_1135 [Pandoravirus salinus]|uniref:Uncharacterized protein n=1 Tax=Pandoravirus salinus TaxID=1349410 RepID=S4W0R8_9VIRU|nr:hypothetical protein psal_cds_1135 [Pandoravirus salinus]AGO85386.1 hypothetical protein psal_cds_1135 [Pandoravirus salinus]
MSTPAEQVAVAPTTVAPAPTTATTTVVAAAPPRRSVPTGWIIGGIVASLIAAMVITAVVMAIVYENRHRRSNVTPSMPVTPSTPQTAAAPLGAPLPVGQYRIRWAPTGLYLGINENGNVASLTTRDTAHTWTYAEATSAGGVAGSLTSSTGLPLSTGTATALVGPVPVYAQSGTAAATGSWVPARDPSGSATLPGTIYNVALGGCLRPNRDGGAGSPVVLAPSCSATERGWVFEPATATA